MSTENKNKIEIFLSEYVLSLQKTKHFNDKFDVIKKNNITKMIPLIDSKEKKIPLEFKNIYIKKYQQKFDKNILVSVLESVTISQRENKPQLYFKVRFPSNIKKKRLIY